MERGLNKATNNNYKKLKKCEWGKLKHDSDCLRNIGEKRQKQVLTDMGNEDIDRSYDG